MATWTNPIDKISAIGRTPLFSGLTADELEQLAVRASERSLARGEVLFAIGEEARGLFVVVDGAIRAFRGAGGREQVLYVERAGGTIAETAIFDDGAYAATAAADEISSVLFLGKQDVRQFLADHPQVAFSALKLLAGRLRRHAELVESIALREVGHRLARFLMAEARSSGYRDEHGWHIDLQLSHQQIAARIGTVREVISRTLRRFEQVGLIQMEGRRVTLRDEILQS